MTKSPTPAPSRSQPHSVRGQDLLLTAGAVLAGPILLACARLILGNGPRQRLGVLLGIDGTPHPGLPQGGLRSVEELLGLVAAGAGLLLCFLSAIGLAASFLHTFLERWHPLTRQRPPCTLWHRLHSTSSLLSPAFMRRVAAAMFSAQITFLGTTGALPAPGTSADDVPSGTTSPLLTAEVPAEEEPSPAGADPPEAPSFRFPPQPHHTQEVAMTPLFQPSPPPEADRPGDTSLRRDAREAHRVTVRPGDTLWELVAEHLGPGTTAWEVAAEWPRWHEVNRETIGPDPNVLRPGTVLTIPGTP